MPRFNHQSIDRAGMLVCAMTFADEGHIAGDYYELGVYRGGSFAEAWRAATGRREPLKSTMQFIAVDSFQGLPETTEQVHMNLYNTGRFAISPQEFSDRIEAQGVDLDRVTIIEGFFSALAPLSGKAAVVWLDCDLYASSVDALRIVTPCLQDGTVLCCGQYFGFRGHPQRGQRRALDEWLQQHPEWSVTRYRDYDLLGQAFIVHGAET